MYNTMIKYIAYFVCIVYIPLTVLRFTYVRIRSYYIDKNIMLFIETIHKLYRVDIGTYYYFIDRYV